MYTEDVVLGKNQPDPNKQSSDGIYDQDKKLNQNGIYDHSRLVGCGGVHHTIPGARIL